MVVMEYIDGGSLRSALDKKRVSIPLPQGANFPPSATLVKRYLLYSKQIAGGMAYLVSSYFVLVELVRCYSRLCTCISYPLSLSLSVCMVCMFVCVCVSLSLCLPLPLPLSLPPLFLLFPLF